MFIFLFFLSGNNLICCKLLWSVLKGSAHCLVFNAAYQQMVRICECRISSSCNGNHIYIYSKTATSPPPALPYQIQVNCGEGLYKIFLQVFFCPVRQMISG